MLIDPLPPSAHLPRLLETYEVAYLLKCSPETVRRLIREGKLTASRPFGRSLRVDPRDLDAFITARRIAALQQAVATHEAALDVELTLGPPVNAGRDGVREPRGPAPVVPIKVSA
jgi:excisionase family DNA binding protein